VTCTSDQIAVQAGCTRDQNAVFSHDQAVKKDADKGSGGWIPRRRGRMVQYLIVLVGCVLFVDALVGDKGVLQMLKKRQEARLLDQSVVAAKNRNARLWAEVRRLKTDLSAIEELARRNLGMMKPGEKVFILKDAPPADTPPAK
jgi:cell division protein FtsB